MGFSMKLLYFLLYFRLQDIVDPVMDEQLAQFVVSSHINSHPKKIMDQNELNNPMDTNVDDKTKLNSETFGDSYDDTETNFGRSYSVSNGHQNYHITIVFPTKISS
jgi:hypothetical protein